MPRLKTPAHNCCSAIYAVGFYTEDRMNILAIVFGIQAIAIVAALSLSMAIYT
jgi:hypothetical protein